MICALVVIGFLCGAPMVTQATDADPEALQQWKRSVGRIICISRSESPGELRLATGSGFVIDKKGHVATNHHVIEKCEAKLTVIFSKEEKSEAEVVAKSENFDLAILRMKEIIRPPLPLYDGPELAMGSRLYVFGFPGTGDISEDAALKVKLFTAIVSAVTMKDQRNIIITQAYMKHGISGGPLTDACGRVVGVATFGVDDLRFAVHVRDLLSLLEAVPHDTQRIADPCRPIRFSMWMLVLLVCAVLLGGVGLILAVRKQVPQVIIKRVTQWSRHKRPSQPKWEESADPITPVEADFLLLVTGGSLNGAEIPFGEELIVAGRDPRVCNIVFTEQSAGISKRHVEFRWEKGARVECRDTWSTGGVFVNGRKLPRGQWTGIEVGQKVALGESGVSISVKKRS